MEKNKHLEGKTMGELAEGTNKSPFDIMLDLAIEEGLRTFFMPKGSDTDPALWKVRAELWQDERTVIGASDAGAHLDMIDTFALKEGEDVTVGIDIESREYNGRWYTNIKGWKVW